MAIAAELWELNQDLAIASLNCPFVQGIGNGSLPKETFAYYIGQDAFFLEAFARAYSIAAAKAPAWDGFNIFHQLAEGVLSELQLHEHYATQWGVDISQVVPGVTTRRYVDFLLVIAWSQDIGVIIAAMLPCMKLYAFLGESLAHTALPDSPYSDWVRSYSSTEFQALAQQLADLAATYTSLTPTVKSAYRYAMECERDFFEAAWREGNG